MDLELNKLALIIWPVKKVTNGFDPQQWDAHLVHAGIVSIQKELLYNMEWTGYKRAWMEL